jgi:hypothetical protein
MYVGLVSHVNEPYDDAEPNIARGRACCGRIVPEGSDGPGRRWIGILCAMSVRYDESTRSG